jgi:Xaa-Pro aminopeptidase
MWAGRPAPGADPVRVHDAAFAGATHADKLAGIAEAVRAAGADAGVVAALDSVAWALNLRGTDVPRTPVARAFLLVRSDASAVLFIDPAKVPDAVRAHLGPAVEVRAYDAFGEALRGLGGSRPAAEGRPTAVMADPATCVAAIFDALEAGGARVVERRDPCALPKATKNAAEMEGSRAAHRRDGRALSRFLAWFDREVPAGELDELGAQAKLEAIRRESNALRDLSFDSISGWGPNGAVVHYRAEPRTNRRIGGDGLYLIDSGGQYTDGTTDVTRTVAVGTPTAEMRDRFTRVLKGHIALATAHFPRGTRGIQLDTLARQHLWAVDADYAHGTGHGVGSYLSVHEGPARIASAPGANGTDEPLAPGMILSNEPGFYAAGAYGIRIENLVLVVEHAPGWLSFETLTLAPIDRRLIEPALLSPGEVAWLDAYHARVLAAHDGLDGADAAWLAAACAPIGGAALAA